MLPQEIIRKKRTGGSLSRDEISSFFNRYIQGEVADYQVSAMLMAMMIRGMNSDETAALTLTMRDSGKVMTWPGDRHSIVDKHSTGGVGDKTSLILMPLCLLEGLKVPMIAGRGLGHTGGTLDKLESIPGMNVFPDVRHVAKLMGEFGGAFMGQTEEIAPLDKRLYAMRDVTDTVESIPLITASILSKKLAEGLGSLVMDVKFGSGAFMQSNDDALALALSIGSVGHAAGLNVKCLLTDMGSPLGDRAGNSLEIQECIEVLAGAGPASTRALSIELARTMVLLAKPNESPDAVTKRLEQYLANGKALETFMALIAAQGGDRRTLEQPKLLPTSKIKIEVMAPDRGYIAECDTRELGLVIIELGGGRRKTSDKINPAVGLSELKRVGDQIDRGAAIAVIHSDDQALAQQLSDRVRRAYKIQEQFTAPTPLVWTVI